MSTNLLSRIDLLPGDIGLSTDNSFLGKGIRFFEMLATKAARKSHAWASIGDGMIIESLTRIRINKQEKYDSHYTEVSVYRVPLSDLEREQFKQGIMVKAADGYGWTKLPMFALDGICSAVARLFGRKKPVFFFTSHAKLFNIPVCSQLVVYSLHNFTSYRLLDGDHLPVDWRCISPDYLEDLLQLPHNKALLIYDYKATK